MAGRSRPDAGYNDSYVAPAPPPPAQTQFRNEPDYGGQHSVAPPPPPSVPSFHSLPAPPVYNSVPSVGYAPGPLSGATGGPPPSLMDSPTYQAFLRSIGLEENQAQTSTQDRVDALRRDFNRNWGDIGQAGVYTREGLGSNFEARGLDASGEFEQAMARQRAAEGQQVGNLRGSVDDQITLLSNDLARRIADINARKADATLQAGQQVYGLGQ